PYVDITNTLEHRVETLRLLPVALPTSGRSHGASRRCTPCIAASLCRFGRFHPLQRVGATVLRGVVAQSSPKIYGVLRRCTSGHRWRVQVGYPLPPVLNTAEFRIYYCRQGTHAAHC